MIFEEIRIQNLFSYFGEEVFELPESSEDKPVVLIAGRNGYGKTSFINSVKLLFLGAAHDPMRVGHVGRKIRVNDYLLGEGAEWQGICNTQARKHGAEFGIQIRWREAQGCVTVRRWWTINGDEPEAHLTIQPDFATDEDLGNPITDPEACEEFLERRLPKSILPFFFYDGEQVQALAASNREGTLQQIEKLLDLAAIDTLDTYLGDIIREWNRAGRKPEEENKLQHIRAQLMFKESDLRAEDAATEEIEHRIDELDREIRKHRSYIDRVRALAAQRDAPRLERDRDELKQKIEADCLRFVQSFPPSAPLWANPDLVERLGRLLDQAVGNPNNLLAEELRGVLNRLPARLLDEPPHSLPVLTAQQKTHYRQKLERIFAQYTESSGSAFFNLGQAETSQLKSRVDYYRQAYAERSRLAEDARQISHAQRLIGEIETRLDEAGQRSPEEEETYRNRQADLQKAEDEKSQLQFELGRRDKARGSLVGEIDRLRRDIAEQETRLTKADINGRKVDRARQAQQLFEHYKQRLKSKRREQIEAALNEHFKMLMTSHSQIAFIRLDESFAMSYLDEHNNPVGMANISTGMKQITAQALLGALSEASGKAVPMIVDTPLARIDRAHQVNLLKNYYPKAARQVIVLPTDSELDAEKYALLKSYIAAEFRLENSDGVHTKVRSGQAMYALESA